LVQLGDLDRGLAHLREAVSRNSGSATTRYHLAVALLEYGNINAARRELEQALLMSERFPERDEAIARLNALTAGR
jgi:Flp pilus assembly protein TadD